jgi:hypothetical protein
MEEKPMTKEKYIEKCKKAAKLVAHLSDKEIPRALNRLSWFMEASGYEIWCI